MSAPIIQTPDFTLRPFQASDASAVASGIAHRDVIHMLVSPPYPYALEDAVAFVDKVKDDPWHWAIDIDGTVGCVAVDEELGYWLAKPHWGQGIMNRAAAEVVDLFFSATAGDRIESGFLHDNAASWRVQEKLGFVRTDERHVHAKARGGLTRNIRTVLTRDVWQRRRAA